MTTLNGSLGSEMKFLLLTSVLIQIFYFRNQGLGGLQLKSKKPLFSGLRIEDMGLFYKTRRRMLLFINEEVWN